MEELKAELKTVLFAIKKDFEAYDVVIHKLPSNEGFQTSSEAYRSKIIEKAYSLKKKLVNLDLEVVRLLGEI